MNICFHTNCQGSGLAYFFERSPFAKGLFIKVILDFQVVLGEVSKEEEREALEKADIIFYHAVNGEFPVKDWKPKKFLRKVPMSVWYNSGPFLSGASAESWAPILKMARDKGINEAVHHAVHEADMGYEARWDSCLAKMKAKERKEGVPEKTRISHWVKEARKSQMHLTMNHPTTEVFHRWANLLLDHVGLQQLPEKLWQNRYSNTNLVGLPCEDFAPEGAVKHLGLRWGGDEVSNLWNYEFVRRKLKELTLAENNSLK